jgi:hypothetical protein
MGVGKPTIGRGEMQTSPVGQGQMIAAGGGILLFIFLFLPWFGAAGVDVDSLSGWQGQTTTDIYLLITALVAVLAAVAGGGSVGPPGMTMNGATALLGAVGTILLVWLILVDFPDGATREIGLFLGALAVFAIAVGGYMAAQADARGVRRERF